MYVCIYHCSHDMKPPLAQFELTILALRAHAVTHSRTGSFILLFEDIWVIMASRRFSLVISETFSFSHSHSTLVDPFTISLTHP